MEGKNSETKKVSHSSLKKLTKPKNLFSEINLVLSDR
jgi:hypothetical protein